MPKRIIDNLEEFAELFVKFTEKKGLLEVFRTAQAIYSNKDSSWRPIKNFFHTRLEQFETAIADLETLEDPIIQLQRFNIFIKQGEWNSTSGNTRLFQSMIKSIIKELTNKDLPDYEEETNQYLREVIIPRLKVLVEKNITLRIESRVKEEQAKRNQHEVQLQNALKTRLFMDAQKAKDFAMSNPDHYAFYLTSTPLNDKLAWQLVWYDLTGNANNLQIWYKLEVLLASLEPLTLPPDKSELAIKIKMECAGLAEEQLTRTKVLIQSSADELPHLVLAYVLSNTKPFQLTWFDSLGEKYPIHIEKHPLLATWLAQKETVTRDDLGRLKTYLQHIRIGGEVDEVNKESVQKTMHQKHGIALICSDQVAKIPRYRLINGTYILTREQDVWTLYQRQKKINQPVDIDTWQGFKELLNQHDGSAQSIPPLLKGKLSDYIKQAKVTFRKPVLCTAVNDFLPRNANEYKACTFVITKNNGQWQLFYINTLQKAIAVNVENLNGLSLFLTSLDEEPSTLKNEQLNEIAYFLAEFKPSSRLNMADFSEVANFFAYRVKTASSQLTPGKLDLNNYSELARFFAKRSVYKPEQTVPTGKLSLSDYPVVTRLFGHRSKEVDSSSALTAHLKPEVTG